MIVCFALTETSKSNDEVLAAETLMSRIRGSLEDLLGTKESPVSQLGVAKDVSRKPEGPVVKPDLDADIKEALHPQDDAPPWLGKLYEKMRLEAAYAKRDYYESHTYNVVNYILEIFLSEDVSEFSVVAGAYTTAEKEFVAKVSSIQEERIFRKPGWQQAFASACEELKALVVKLENLVTAMTNNSELTGSDEGAKFIKKKSDLVLVLRRIVFRLEADMDATLEAYNIEKRDDIILVHPKDDEVKRTLQVEEQLPKDEL